MELIQIIESTVFIFSLGLMVLFVLSYLFFRIKNRDNSFPLEIPDKKDNLIITYETPPQKATTNSVNKIDRPKRFVVVNETMRKEDAVATMNSWRQVNPRFYIYKPGRNKIVTNLQLSRIKD